MLGDSILKHVKGYSILSLLNDYNVYLDDFPGARVRCMKNYDNTLSANPTSN